MLCKFVFLAIVALATVSQGQACTRTAAMRLGRCFEPLSAYTMGNVGEDRLPSFCRDGRVAVSCMHSLLEDCPELRSTMGGNLELIENNINRPCTGVQTGALEIEAPETEAPEIEAPETEAPEIEAAETEAPETDAPWTVAPETEAPETDAPETDTNVVSQCTPKDIRRMQKCARRLQRFAGRSNLKCSKVRKTMDCLETTTRRCSDAMGNAELPFDTIREQLLGSCVETNQLPEESTSEPQNGDVVEEGEEGEEEGEEEVDMCPEDVEYRMQRCVEDMNGVLASFRSGAADLSEACGSLTSAVDCVSDYMEVCSDHPMVGQLSRMLNMDRTRGYVDQICSGGGSGPRPEEGDSECPADYESRMQACVEPMQTMNPQVIDEAVCRAADAAFDCIDEVINACRNTPEVSAFTNILNLDSARSMVREVCTTGTLQPGPGVDANCPSDHNGRLLECIEPLKEFQQSPAVSVQAMCRVAKTGFDCLDDIMGKCANQPDVRAMNSMLNFDHLRGMLRDQCVAKTSGADNSCDVADPGEELLDCNNQLQNVVSSGGSIVVKCRRMFESLGCFDRLIANCPSHPSIVAFTDMLDLDEVRGTLTAHCPSRK